MWDFGQSAGLGMSGASFFFVTLEGKQGLEQDFIAN